MLERREITRDTLSPLLRLTLRPGQEHLVAPAAVTIAQATYELGSHVWGLWLGETAVGLLAMLDPREAELMEGDDPEAAYIWRLMIDAGHQGQGHGRSAVEACVAQARDWGLPRLATSVVETDDSNVGFYEHLGFQRTGVMVEGEIVLSRAV